MKTLSASLLAALAVTVACNGARPNIDTDKPGDDVETPVEEEEVKPFIAEERFGAELVDHLPVVDFDKLLTDPGFYEGMELETRGTVRQSCQVRGCWMAVRNTDDANSKEMTVRFKDYAFFMPFNSRGAEVRYQGTLFLDVLTAAEADELRAEGYELPAAEADGTVNQLLFMASGVEMAGRDQSGR